MAVEAGFDGIVVSNHGARQLDYTPATISVLEKFTRRGTDVFKALALGAKAVLIGRPIVYGLAAKGEYGDKKMESEPVNVKEFQELAKQVLPKMYYDYYAGGAEDQYTLKQNVEAFQRITIRPRILVDVSRIDMSTTVLGHEISAPIMVAPTAMHQLAHSEGEVATARGAAACNTIMILSYNSTCTVEEVASSCNANDGSGLEAYANETFDSSLCWEVIGWLRSITSLPILVKGVLTHEDARMAVEAGVDGIVVSNHGARQLDYSPATISVLEEVVHAVGGKVPVLFDGGIRRGTDVFKALALGAQAVLVGRPVVYGLAAKGEYGVRRVLEMLKDELELTMALSGCPRLQDITRRHYEWDKGISIVSEAAINDHQHKQLINMASEPVNVKEFQELAKNVLPKMYYDFYTGGAEDQYTLKQNVEAFQRITIRPRILLDVSRIDMSTTVLGYKISAPIMVAPTGMHQFAHPEGEVATARAAAACNTIMVLSYSSNCSVEEVASSCNAVRFFQLYVLVLLKLIVFKRRDISAQIVQRAEKSGFKAIVLTVDTPRLGRREADIKNKYIGASNGGSALESYANETLDSSLRWEDIGWLRSITSLPILIKGVLTHEDARMAVEAGVSGIVVSNHGARQLDYTPATISVLEEVVHAVEGKVPVLFDGGVRRGTDVFKALALGAQAVLVGRPVIYGLAAKGEYGVRRVLEMLKYELELTMALSGCPQLQDITRDHVRTEHERLRSML
ncbi:hypothetical protein FEM48_Zijuj01G0265700 [Ziziphus jujuba var. spinosa]|uniref:(S)-2-hydroxy-acid oxidase n=1 Tax=Ziziphus jujuba var. spinosa TaxID=714518 RepID=A0A978W513_ZIZJJ|nr:hypothetical protein FEM48_Zijuj01G0265700 [Ziziphus jujuba var. spinosa]